MQTILEKVKRIRYKPVIEKLTKDGKTIYKRYITVYGRDLLTIVLTAEKKEYLDIKAFVEGEKNPREKQ